jgi:hypothetical protein
MREKRLVIKFDRRLKGENFLFMFLSFKFFRVCFRETVKIMLFILTVYAITVKKYETVREFSVSVTVLYTHKLITNFPDGCLISLVGTVKIISIFLCVFHKPSR